MPNNDPRDRPCVSWDAADKPYICPHGVHEIGSVLHFRCADAKRAHDAKLTPPNPPLTEAKTQSSAEKKSPRAKKPTALPYLDMGSIPPEADEKYRYVLWRQWGEGTKICLFAMLNPSTGSALVDDPTLRRCVGFAKRWGFDQLRVVNLFALRGSDPRCLEPNYADAVGPDNDLHISFAAALATKIVVAWGAHETMGRDNTVTRSLARYDDIYRFAPKKRETFPPHPLYLSDQHELALYRRKIPEVTP